MEEGEYFEHSFSLTDDNTPRSPFLEWYRSQPKEVWLIDKDGNQIGPVAIIEPQQ